jgi:hypothetical protein
MTVRKHSNKAMTTVLPVRDDQITSARGFEKKRIVTFSESYRSPGFMPSLAVSLSASLDVTLSSSPYVSWRWTVPPSGPGPRKVAASLLGVCRLCRASRSRRGVHVNGDDDDEESVMSGNLSNQ